MEKWLENFAESSFRRSSDVAHDLKTPLNVAVLNLELLRMRLQKLLPAEDEKTSGYMKAVEIELRRMARIFDAYFVYSAPPRELPDPEKVTFRPLLEEACRNEGIDLSAVSDVSLLGHPARLRELCKQLVNGAKKIFEDIVISEERGSGRYLLRIKGTPIARDGSEVGKIFKFYYTDSSGAPELSLATARLIAETYGGSLDLRDDAGGSELEVVLPMGEQ